MEAREFSEDNLLMDIQRTKAMDDGWHWGEKKSPAQSVSLGFLSMWSPRFISWAPPLNLPPIPCGGVKASEKHEKKQGHIGQRGQDWMGWESCHHMRRLATEKRKDDLSVWLWGADQGQ